MTLDYYYKYIIIALFKEYLHKLSIAAVGFLILYTFFLTFALNRYDSKSDMWAVGCVLYEILTLKKVFDASVSNRYYLNSHFIPLDLDALSLFQPFRHLMTVC